MTFSDGTDEQPPQMADLHQACTRMARADYCGDGTPYTIDGVGVSRCDAHGDGPQRFP